MSRQLLKRLESFRKSRGLSILALCRMMDTHNVTYHRWKNAKQITGPYKKIIHDFLAKHESPSQTLAVQSQASSLSTRPAADIAVIGLACQYPGAINIKELWENILARRVQFRRMPDNRLPLAEYFDPDPKAPEKTYVAKAALIDNFVFDWAAWRVPKKTFESTDIVHWLALDVALRALSDAGYKPEDMPKETTGVIVGNTLTGEQTRSQTMRLRWPYVKKSLAATLNSLGLNPDEQAHVTAAMEGIYKSAFYPITEDSLAGGLANTIAGRICNYLNFKGGGYIVDGACSSSLLAVATAANALKLGDLDIALAGGVDVSLDPFELVGFAKAGALAKDKMQVYDKNAAGFIPGEGCGFVVLKRLADALRDKNYIYAVIKGWGISSDGKGGIMEPSVPGQALAIERAYRQADYKPDVIHFVEGHGTGTTKGDRVEVEGIATVVNKCGRSLIRDVGITSFKSIVGHTKAAAGVGGLIKAVLAVNQRVIPPTANCQEPNEIFSGTAQAMYPVMQGAVLEKNKTVRAGISSAGFGGINCHIAIESKDAAKKEIASTISERALLVSNQETEIFVFGATTVILLRNLIRKFKEDLRFISQAEMADLAKRLSKNIKKKMTVRIAIVTDSPENLYQALCAADEALGQEIEDGEVKIIGISAPNTRIWLSQNVKKQRVGFLYPGQAAQKLNMTRVLFERFDWARALADITKTPIADFIYKSLDRFLSKEERAEFSRQLSQTEITQLAVTFSSLVWDEFLAKLGIAPVVVGGHSLGELAAFYKAGAFDKEILLKFAEFRGQAMAGGAGTVAKCIHRVIARSERSERRSNLVEPPKIARLPARQASLPSVARNDTNAISQQSQEASGAMVSLFCSLTKAKELLGRVGGNLVIANINSPSQIVFSGAKKDINRLVEAAKKQDIAAYVLPVSNAFHSSFMKAASEKIKNCRLLDGAIALKEPRLYSVLDGRILNGKTILKDYFAKQVTSSINFPALVQSMTKECDLLIEVGPGRILSDLVKAINKEKGVVCLPVESSPTADRDLNIVLAECFVRGMNIHWDELYANRLIRPFVIPSKKKFITNQCERPLKIPEAGEGEVRLSAAIPETAVSSTETTDVQGPEGDRDVIVAGTDQVGQTLLRLVQELTGFNKDSIHLNLRLLDDLNLDSIKAAELIAEAAKIFGIAGEIEPTQYSNRTLDEIRQKIEELAQEKKTGKSQAGTLADLLKRYAKDTWVRNFVERFEPEPIAVSDTAELAEIKDALIVCGLSGKEIAENLKKALSKIKTRIVGVNEIPAVGGKFDLVIALLDGNVTDQLDDENLRSMIGRLQQIIICAADAKQVVFAQLGGTGDFNTSRVRALASTLHLERPDLTLRILDFDRCLAKQMIATRLVEEMQAATGFTIAGYTEKGVRQVPVFDVSDPASYAPRDIRWLKNDVVLVTGGAKGITAECALEFGRMTKAQMVLLGRSALNDEIKQTLKRFSQEKLRCVYRHCDVTDPAQVKRIVAEVQKEFGPVTGVIHGAGLNSLKRLKQANVDEVYKESLPKIMGAVNILEALDVPAAAPSSSAPLKLFVAMGSIIGVTGMEGSGWYGFANEVLAQYLRQWARGDKARAVVVPAFSVWDEVGMGIKLGSVEKLSERGISAIPVAEGVKRFRDVVERDPRADQVVITARVSGLDTLRVAPLKPAPGWRFIEDIQYCVPGVELVSRVHLNVTDDAYVRDHAWKGSLLFPLVFGLEAMAEAACYLTGQRDIEGFRFENVDCPRPIPVNEQNGTMIEIHALALEEASARKVKVEIFCEQSSFKEPHFSAVVEINPVTKSSVPKIAEDKLKRDLGFDMKTEIYGPILFQGGEFQRIEWIHDLCYDATKKKGECVATMGNQPKTGLLIGNPYLVDAVLQSMQLIIPQDSCLPRDVEAIEIIPRRANAGARPVQSMIKRLDEDYYRGDGQTLGDGFGVRVTNCRLKILENLPNNPTVEELTSPALRAQRQIETRLNKLAGELGFVPPVVRCLCDDRLKGAKKDPRHKIELPVIKAAVEAVFARDKKKPEKFQITWDKSGRPLVKGKNVGDIHVSLSHDGEFLLVVAGHGKQGCDVETVKERSPRDWQALLGKERYDLVKELVAKGHDHNFSGTAVWAVHESILKTTRDLNGQILIGRVASNYVFFVIKDAIGDQGIVAFKIKFENNEDRIVSVVARNNIALKRKENVNEEVNFGREIGYNEEAFNVKMDNSGPQDQFVFIKNYPITFNTNKLLSRRVYFTSYFDWMGEVREQSANPIMEHLIGKFESGDWGLATYFTKLQILGELKASDILQVRFWSEDAVSRVKGAYDLCADWKKIASSGREERVAFSRQRVIWVKIVSRGVAQVGELPKFLEQFMDKMKARTKEKKPLERLPEPYKLLDKGEKQFSSNGIGNSAVLYRKNVRTTLENSNLIGNIYFSNYAKWLGMVVDLYIYEHASEFVLGGEGRGEFTCIKCEIDHLNEAMPFDEIQIEMGLDSLYQRAVVFNFDFYLINCGRKIKKLAHARYEAIWTNRANDDQIIAAAIPHEISQQLLRTRMK